MVRLKKSLGQHLLLSKGVLLRIAQSLEIKEGDRVIEIGGGTGNLTRILLTFPLTKLTVIEKDPRMVHILSTIEDERLEVIEGDATEVDLSYFGNGIKVTGNLPYNVGSLILEMVVRAYERVDRAVFTLQKEVCERVLFRKEKSRLGAFVSTYFDVSYVTSVPARFFKPPPRVSSGVLLLTKKHAEGVLPPPHKYSSFLQKLFLHKRKTIGKKFSVSVLEEAGVAPKKRAEELSLEEILKLYNVIEGKG